MISFIVQPQSNLSEPAKKRPVRTWLIIETILAIPAVAVAGFVAMMSPMLFDAPGSADNPAMMLLFSGMVGLPLSLIVGVLLAWIAVAMKRDRGALWFSLLPLLPILACLAAVLWLQMQ